jgi:hypothetical protein
MRKRTIVVPLAGVAFGAVAALLAAPSASAAPAVVDTAAVTHTVAPQESSDPLPAPIDPTAGVKFFWEHLETYHFGKPLLGFGEGLSDPVGWFNYHFANTGLETLARTVSPANAAPAVNGDTWTRGTAPTKSAPEPNNPLPLPVDPTAGLKFFWEHLETYHFGKPLLGFGEGLSDPVGWFNYHFANTGLETVYRTLKPSYQAPPVNGDTWVGSQPPADTQGSGGGSYGSSAAPKAAPATQSTARSAATSEAQSAAAPASRSVSQSTPEANPVSSAASTLTSTVGSLTGSLLGAGH